jgi:hypothetical protein
MNNTKRMFLPQPIQQSLLSGATQVSVPVRPQPRLSLKGNWWWDFSGGIGAYPDDTFLSEALIEHCPYPVGTVVWVPETWMTNGADSLYQLMARGKIAPRIIYKATSPEYGRMFKWRASTTMPEWAARFRYVVKGVKAEVLLQRGWQGVTNDTD